MLTGLATDKGGETLGGSSTLQDVIQIKEDLLVIELVNVIHRWLPSSLCALSAACTQSLKGMTYLWTAVDCRACKDDSDAYLWPLAPISPSEKGMRAHLLSLMTDKA